MLVRLLLGKYAGRVADMSYIDAVRGEANGSLIRLAQHEAARHASGAEEIEDVVESVMVVRRPMPIAATPSVAKRQGGWPKGKKRGSRAAPAA